MVTFKKPVLFICWIQAWLGLHCVGIKAPGWPLSALPFTLPSSELLLANFKEFISKAFGRHRTARLRLEFAASAERVEPWLLGEPSSLFLLFTQAKCELHSCGAWRLHSPLIWTVQQEGKVAVEGRYCQNKGTSNSAMERFHVSSPPPQNARLAL